MIPKPNSNALAYELYKDTGNELLGKIPEHWVLLTIKRVLKKRDGIKIGPFGSSLKLEDMCDVSRYKVYGQENIISGDFTKGKRYILPEKYSDMVAYELRATDIIISMMGTIGRCKMVPNGVQPGIMDSHLIRLRLDHSVINPLFLELIIDEAPYLIEQMKIASKGSIMSGLNSTIIKNLLVAVPSYSEQCNIIYFLKNALPIIAKTIQAKKKLISRLKDFEVAIIHRTVIKGLNLGVPLKPSDVDWLGDVPEHWDVRSFSLLSKFISRRGRPDLQLLSVVREKGVIPRAEMSEEENHNYVPDDLANYKVVNSGNLVINKMKAWQGSVGIAPIDGIVSPAYYVYDIAIAEKKYAHYLLRSKRYVDFFAQASDGVRTGQWDLRISELKKIPLLVPPAEEQSEIVDYLEKKIVEIERVIDLTNHQIEYLNEYRSRLIFDVVTGKVDVRSFSADTSEEEFDSLLPKMVAEHTGDYS